VVLIVGWLVGGLAGFWPPGGVAHSSLVTPVLRLVSHSVLRFFLALHSIVVVLSACVLGHSGCAPRCFFPASFIGFFLRCIPSWLFVVCLRAMFFLGWKACSSRARGSCATDGDSSHTARRADSDATTRDRTEGSSVSRSQNNPARPRLQTSSKSEKKKKKSATPSTPPRPI